MNVAEFEEFKSFLLKILMPELDEGNELEEGEFYPYITIDNTMVPLKIYYKSRLREPWADIDYECIEDEMPFDMQMCDYANHMLIEYFHNGEKVLTELVKVEHEIINESFMMVYRVNGVLVRWDGYYNSYSGVRCNIDSLYLCEKKEVKKYTYPKKGLSK